MTSPTFKKQYTFVLSFIFIGIGIYKLYNHFYVGKEVATYQLALASFLILLGLYQLLGSFITRKKQ